VPVLTPPEPLTTSHDLSKFCSGVQTLDDWLQRRALKNETNLASRTYVTCDESRVVGYYCLAAGAVALAGAPKKLTRNMPDPIPVMVLGRLAIDKAYQNRGIGKGLLLDAVRRSAQAAQIAGVSTLLVHALSEEARRFYLAQGFIESPVQPMTLCLRLVDVIEGWRQAAEQGPHSN
jgi:GNAT superfamily N-acetyltransferase